MQSGGIRPPAWKPPCPCPSLCKTINQWHLSVSDAIWRQISACLKTSLPLSISHWEKNWTLQKILYIAVWHSSRQQSGGRSLPIPISIVIQMIMYPYFMLDKTFDFVFLPGQAKTDSAKNTNTCKLPMQRPNQTCEWSLLGKWSWHSLLWSRSRQVSHF